MDVTHKYITTTIFEKYIFPILYENVICIKEYEFIAKHAEGEGRRKASQPQSQSVVKSQIL